MRGFTVLFEPKEEPKVDVVFLHGFNGDPKKTWTKTLPGEPSSRKALLRLRSALKRQVSNASVACDASSLQPPSSSTQSFHESERIDDQDVAASSNVGKEVDEIYWPRDLVPKTVPYARVLTYGYDIKVQHAFGPSISQNSVYDHARNFLCDLEQHRRAEGEAARPLLFIAHSLGGIVIKEALRRSQASQDVQPAGLHQIFRHTKGVIFFGTPHRGADPRYFPHVLIGGVAEALGVKVNQDVFNTLMPNDSRVRELGTEFITMARASGWKIHSFQEELGVKGLFGKKVVEDYSSCLDDPSIETKQHISANHMEMCRFSGFADPQYQKVIGALRAIIQPAPMQQARSGPLSISEADIMKKLCVADIVAEMELLQKRKDQLLVDSYKWIFDHKEYREFIKSSHRNPDAKTLLWIKGDAGKGKTMLLMGIIHQLEEDLKTRFDSTCHG